MKISSIPSTGFLRLEQIIGNQDKNIPALIPISRSSWLRGVEEGKFPKPIHLTLKTVAWRVEDILQLIDDLYGAPSVHLESQKKSGMSVTPSH